MTTQAERFEEATNPKAINLEEAVKEFFEILDSWETSDSGREFRPTIINSCRVVHVAKLEKLLPILRKMAGVKEPYKLNND